MMCRPPTLNGKVKAVRNRAAVLKMPGVTHVVTISTGVAVRAKTFGQCIDAIRELQVDWLGGTAEGVSDADVLAELKAAEIPLAVPSLPGVPGAVQSIDSEFTFWFASNSALETNCAIADVRADRAEIWGGLKSPITAQQKIAERDRAARRQGQGARHDRRRLVRAQAVLRRRARGRGGVEGDGQAGQADVAPGRRLPAGTRAPDVDGAHASHDRRQGRARLRAAAHLASSPTSATGSARSSPPPRRTCPSATSGSRRPSTR